jgi:chromosomal replication initiation ATPase DnaA
MTKETILQVVCKELNVNSGSVLQDNNIQGARTREFVQARFWAMYFMRKYTDASLDSIGLFFKRDHPTIMNGLRKIEESMKIYSDQRVIHGKIDLALVEVRILEAESILKTRLELLLNEYISKAKQITAELINK